ncbi:MAG: hypothetical protein ACOCYV_02230 [Planctomycetota bacterium]
MAAPEPIFPLRERTVGQIHDLALLLLRHHRRRIALLALPPLLVCCAGLIAAMRVGVGSGPGARVLMLILGISTLGPLLTAPVTAFLAEAAFSPQPPRGAVRRRLRGRLFMFGRTVLFWRVAPVLTICWLGEARWQSMLAALLWLLVLDFRRRHAPEVILLEGQDRRAGRGRTGQLARQAGARDLGEMLVHLLLLGIGLVTVCWSLLLMRSVFVQGRLFANVWGWAWDPLASPGPWIVVMALTVHACASRFLAYIDLRTRSEGWAVETALRLAAGDLGGGAR